MARANHRLAALAPLLFLVAWSSGAIAVKFGLQSASVWSFLALRSIGSFAVFLFVLAGAQVLGKPGLASWRDGWSLDAVCTGILMQVAYQGSYFLAISEQLSLGTLTIILGCQPIIVSVLAREPMNAMKIGCLLGSVVGLIVAVSGSRSLTLNSVSGAAYALVALFSIAAAAVLQARSNRPLLPVMLVQYGVGSVAYGLVLAIVGWRATFDGPFIASITWMILVVSTGATFLLFHMLKNDVASRVSSLFFFVPILSMCADKWIFDAPVSIKTVAGSSVVLIFVVLYRSANAQRAPISGQPQFPERAGGVPRDGT